MRGPASRESSRGRKPLFSASPTGHSLIRRTSCVCGVGGGEGVHHCFVLLTRACMHPHTHTHLYYNKHECYKWGHESEEVWVEGDPRKVDQQCQQMKPFAHPHRGRSGRTERERGTHNSTLDELPASFLASLYPSVSLPSSSLLGLESSCPRCFRGLGPHQYHGGNR